MAAPARRRRGNASSPDSSEEPAREAPHRPVDAWPIRLPWLPAQADARPGSVLSRASSDRHPDASRSVRTGAFRKAIGISFRCAARHAATAGKSPRNRSSVLQCGGTRGSRNSAHADSCLRRPEKLPVLLQSDSCRSFVAGRHVTQTPGRRSVLSFKGFDGAAREGPALLRPRLKLNYDCHVILVRCRDQPPECGHLGNATAAHLDSLISAAIAL
ncbi:hypothetical protein MES5069_490023 [Mesorhizobium escarrei]|uniref:Uncharacterized protein n=1 Tax=Mesorhizobium escarrei TaxID=666018 RepID=A0ABM9E983_9HYPH|nr:hypothetical protein MES5069_490023 [Mesorhizobium escarrei]